MAILETNEMMFTAFEPKLPLFKPAGANHSAPILSEAAIAPGTITDGGTNVGLFEEGSNTLTHG